MATQVNISETVTREQAEQEYPGWGGKAWDTSRETMDSQMRLAADVAAKRIENTRTNGNVWQEVQTAVHVLKELLPIVLLFANETNTEIPAAIGIHAPEVIDGLQKLTGDLRAWPSNTEDDSDPNDDLDLNSTTG